MKLFYLLLAIFFVLGSLLEFWLTFHHDRAYYNKRDFINSLGLMLSGLAIDLLIKTLALYLLYRLSLHALVSLGYQWWVWCLCYLAWDFIFYIKHYLEHNVRILWAIHVNHHSSAYMNLSTSLRSGVFKSFYRYFFWAIPIGIGFPLPMFLILYGWGKVWAFFGHSQKLGRWGILERFMVTPTHHLLHHSCNDGHLNKNFGETFLIWDQLLGTFQQAKSDLRFGIPEAVNHDDFRDVVLHEFRSIGRDLRQARSFRRKLCILFGKPGSFSPKSTESWPSSSAAA